MRAETEAMPKYFQRGRGSQWARVELGVFVALFVWRRGYRSVWQNRWTGFGLGVALVSTNFKGRELVRRHLAFAGTYKLAARVTILRAAAFPVIGVGALEGFFDGPPLSWHADVPAASDDGLCAVLGSVNALDWRYASGALVRKGSGQNSQYPVLSPNHG